jgi:uncharacterized protein with HEPN domain
MIAGQDYEHLDDMLRHAEEAIRLLGDLDARALAGDRRTYLAVSYDLLVVGEAAGRTSSDVRALLAGVPWERIIGMRNRLAHGYDEIDLEVVVNTVRTRLPELVAEIRRALEANSA